MLTIRTKQFEALSSAWRVDFLARLHRHLLSKFPEQANLAGPRAVETIVADAARIAAQLDADTIPAVTTLAELMLTHPDQISSAFQSQWWRNPETEGAVKLDLLTHRIRGVSEEG